MPIYFISDLHLSESQPHITAGFKHFLNSLLLDASALYILGDFFEVWIGDDDTTPFNRDIASELRRVSDKIPVYFQHGNRDFLLGSQYAEQCGMKLLKESEILEFGNHRALLMHGDQLCTDDVDYMAFRNMVRDPLWQHGFLDKTLSERRAIATQLRSQSKSMAAEKADDIMDVNQNSVVEALRANHVVLMIHGHTHRPDVHHFEIDNRQATRIVLGDWYQRGYYLKMTENDFELIHFPLP